MNIHSSRENSSNGSRSNAGKVQGVAGKTEADYYLALGKAAIGIVTADGITARISEIESYLANTNKANELRNIVERNFLKGVVTQAKAQVGTLDDYLKRP